MSKSEVTERGSLLAMTSNQTVETTGSRFKGFLIRIAVVLGVAITWACATQFTKSALNIDSKRFFAPYSLVWFNTSFMSICYPIFIFYAILIEKRKLSEVNEHSALIFSANGLSVQSFLKKVTPFLVLWILANYSFGQSLGRISASAAASIMSSNAAMVCILSSLLIKEKFTVEKVLSVLFAIGGVIVISMDREFAGDLIGILLVTFSAATAAFYKYNGNATLGQVSMFMTGLGLMDLFVNVIPSAILVLTKVDHIEFDAVPWLPLAGSATLGLLYNFKVNFGIALLSPLIISIGMLCGIPLSAAIDIIFRQMDITVTFVVGAVLIIVSFVLSTIPVRQLSRNVFGKKEKTETVDGVHRT
ncbi:hypothetical protein M3Y94_00794900 [Aphelenchoides besseyi]|nr:hypothetical protein M3Y94_00794900 [Aphelenchoides besseyi]